MLALTFTRLAAKEMKERVMQLVGISEGQKLTVGTFHSFCVRVLRELGNTVGLDSNFTIYDEDDRTAIIRSCIDELGYKKVKLQDVLDNLYSEIDADLPVAKVVAEYHNRLARNNAIDLDGLLVSTRDVLTFDQAQRELQNRYRYVFVDEFQDTNDIQFEIIQLLNPENLFVVGDDFQSIYGWRGANVQNIIEFPDRHPGCEVIKLERNYRSTREIVTAANELIGHNENQTKKVLISDRPGDPIIRVTVRNEEIEAELIADEIARKFNFGNWSDIAILARTNRQLLVIKDNLDRHQIPAQIVTNSDDVFKKPDIRSLTNLIEAALNPENDTLVRRVVNFPEIRIADLSLSILDYRSIESGKSLMETMRSSSISGAIDFCQLLDLIKSFTEEADTAIELIKRVMLLIGLNSYYLSKDLANRAENLKKMLEEVKRWQSVQDELGESVGIYYFLKWLKTKDLQEKLVQEKVDAVKLMTVHASKGLEFPVVFVVGMNQNTFPSHKADDLEEEHACSMYRLLGRRIACTLPGLSKSQLIPGDQ